MSLDAKLLGQLGMWEAWQDFVKASLPNFAANPVYVEQLSPSRKEFNDVADYVSKLAHVSAGKLRDCEFGGVAHETQALGPVTRMWLDANVEMDFISRNSFAKKILEVGAGYGRLAGMLAPFCDRYVCVDAVPVSTEICRTYCARFAPTAEVPTLGEFCASAKPGGFDLAINIHSWNECTVENVGHWLDAIEYLKIPRLFTVSHGQGAGAYRTQEHGQPSFRHLLETKFNLVAEENIGLGKHPHALWSLKSTS